MIEQGSIESLSGVLAVVRPKSSAACFGCMKQRCKAGRELIQAENPLGLSLAIGQVVETEFPAASARAQAALALGPPVLSFIAGYLLAGLAAAPSDPFRAFCGAAALFATALIVYRIRRRFPPKNLQRIIGIISEPGQGTATR
ncbi:MAG: SoxR reducing system RseC family protein [Treponema sp.]|jgi:positive regulator of sigma E activity|nr:SoxR reducing system RseC family protein [Treponema sp.]